MKITHWIASNSYAIFITEIDPSTGYFVFAARQVRRTSCNRTKNYAAACRAAAAAIDRFLLHAPDLSSKPPGAAAAVDRRDRHTDGRTHDRFKTLTAYWADRPRHKSCGLHLTRLSIMATSVDLWLEHIVNAENVARNTDFTSIHPTFDCSVYHYQGRFRGVRVQETNSQRRRRKGFNPIREHSICTGCRISSPCRQKRAPRF